MKKALTNSLVPTQKAGRHSSTGYPPWPKLLSHPGNQDGSFAVWLMSLAEEAAEVLGELGDRRAVEPLIITLKDPNSSVRATAAGALKTITDQDAHKERTPPYGESGV